MYKDKMSVRGMVNMLTKFESTRIIHEEIEDDEKFYAACDLLESQMDEQDPDEEIDVDTKALFEEMAKLSAETNISKGAAKPKQKVDKIDTFAAIAGVLGKVEESTGKQRGEKTTEQRLSEFYALFPHIKEIEGTLGPFNFATERSYYFERNEYNQIQKLPIDESFKRTKRDAQIIPYTREKT